MIDDQIDDQIDPNETLDGEMVVDDYEIARLQAEFDEAEAQAAEEMARIEQEERERFEQERDALMSRLAADVEGELDKRSGRRALKETEWLAAERLLLGALANRRGVPNADDPFPLADDNDRKRPEVNIVRQKVGIAISQLESYVMPSDDKDFTMSSVAESADERLAAMIYPEATPEEIPALQEQAAKAHEDVIYGQFLACNYGDNVRAGIRSKVVLGTAVMKGPLNSERLRSTWEPAMGDDGQVVFIRSFVPEKSPSVRNVDLWNFYPNEQHHDIKDVPDAIEVHPMTHRDLRKLANHPGFFRDKIEELLEEGPKHSRLPTFAKRASLTNSQSNIEAKFVVMERNGPITVGELEKLGIEPPVTNVMDVVIAEVWVCQGRVIRISLSILEGETAIPYAVDVWESDPASIFGYGVPILVEDAQRVVNESWKMVLDNAGASAGPQAIIDRNKIQPANGSWALEPFKLWLTTEFADGRAADAIYFYSTPSAAAELVSILQLAKGFADEESSIPLIAGGLEPAQGVPSTATGGVMAMKAATSVLVNKAKSWCDNITEPCVQWMYAWNMQFHPDPMIKGSFQIDVRSSTEVLAKQIEAGDLERLVLMAGQNESVGAVVRMDELIRQQIRSMRVPHKSLIKTPEEIQAEAEARQQQSEQAQQSDPNFLRAQTEMKRLELETAKFQHETEMAAVKLEAEQRAAVMESEHRLAAIQARMIESQARTAQAQAQLEVAMLQVAARSETDRAKILAQIDLERSRQDLESLKIQAQTYMDLEKLKEQRDRNREQGQFASRIAENP